VDIWKIEGRNSYGNNRQTSKLHCPFYMHKTFNKIYKTYLSLCKKIQNLYARLWSFNLCYQTLQYHIGCSGWSYSAWQGPFYPSNLENSRWLNYYSRVFDFVEIDSSFYRTPKAFMVKNWCKKTPDHFRVTLLLSNC
jgi:Protein of unknown function DUF72